MPFRSPSNPCSNPKFGLWSDLGSQNTIPQTACKNSNWFGNYDCSKNAILGSRTHFFFSFFFSRLFFPPIFNILPLLRFGPNLVHLFLATFLRWVFRRFPKFPPPSPKHLYFFYIQISPFLTHFQCSDLPEIWYTYSLQHSSGGYFAVFRNSPPPSPRNTSTLFTYKSPHF